ncbi:hypothetical protein QLX08_001578 [Tetragonisca angustula]|uniref:Uncharacterized protein n=1 Tax=Tetragonisca angustula TaxID=166442 RepID=A0AAW1AEK9_9HYME
MLNLTDIRVKFNTSGERQSLLLSLLMSRTPTRHEGSLFPEGAAAYDESSTHVHEVVGCVVKNTLTRRFHWTNENQPMIHRCKQYVPSRKEEIRADNQRTLC